MLFRKRRRLRDVPFSDLYRALAEAMDTDDDGPREQPGQPVRTAVVPRTGFGNWDVPPGVRVVGDRMTIERCDGEW